MITKINSQALIKIAGNKVVRQLQCWDRAVTQSPNDPEKVDIKLSHEHYQNVCYKIVAGAFKWSQGSPPDESSILQDSNMITYSSLIRIMVSKIVKSPKLLYALGSKTLQLFSKIASKAEKAHP